MEGRTLRVKTVERPGVGRTAKLEAADLAHADGGQVERTRWRDAAEREILARTKIPPRVEG